MGKQEIVFHTQNIQACMIQTVPKVQVFCFHLRRAALASLCSCCACKTEKKVSYPCLIVMENPALTKKGVRDRTPLGQKTRRCELLHIAPLWPNALSAF